MLTQRARQRGGEADVVVCGGGAAGLAAALSAARQGASVILLEAHRSPGGTVARSLIHTLAGFYDSQGEMIQDGLAAELTWRLMMCDPRAGRRKMGRLWVFSVCPNVYLAMVRRWLAESPNITLHCQTTAVGVIERGGRIVEVVANGPRGVLQLSPRAVIDATGTAAVVRLLDESLVIEDEQGAAGGWIFRVRGMAPSSLDFPRGVAIARAVREGVAESRLPENCEKTWLDRGIEADEAFVKLFVPLEKDWPAHIREISRRSRSIQDALVPFLRTLPGFSAIRVTQTGALGIRDGGRIRGRYTLTVEDVRSGRRFSDAAARCAWPIEYWHPQQGVSIEYLPAGMHYDIPMRSLQLPGLDNLWVAGKCLSADRQAQASARVVGPCWGMGEATGKAAAAYCSVLPGLVAGGVA